LQFSTDTPCLTSVIPAIDKIDNELTKALKNKDHSLALQAALVIGKGLLNKYYSLTDQSEVYRIAIGLSSILSTFMILIHFSTPSQVQIKVLYETQLGTRVDRNCKRYCQRSVQVFIC
jgi:hypothetical protein